jgi:hypothetical protein
MALELDKDKLLAHLKAEMAKRTEARFERPKELAEWFYGPGGSEPEENLRDMSHLYNQAYWDGAVDALSAVLTFDDDIRGAQAIAAFTENLRNAEG